MPKQAAGTTLRLDLDIQDLVRVRLAEKKLKLTPLVNQLLRDWLSPKPAIAVPVVSAPAQKLTYRPENKPWHDRLELVLNDPDEALGIQKNLEWAEKTVLGKRSNARRTASG